MQDMYFNTNAWYPGARISYLCLISMLGMIFLKVMVEHWISPIFDQYVRDAISLWEVNIHLENGLHYLLQLQRDRGVPSYIFGKGNRV
jgi:hypothetical protein